MAGLKRKLKKSKVISAIYARLRPSLVPLLAVVSYPLCCRFLYYETYDRLPNLKNPKKLSEKLAWLSLNVYRKDPLVVKCADKYAVRDYVREKGCSNILNEVLGVWNSVDEINWEQLPEKFVLKCNHGSGYNIICHSKKEFNIDDAKNKISKWMKAEYWKRSGEIFYKKIPKKIICEKFIETNNGLPPIDYKIFCSNGEPRFLFVAKDRVGSHVSDVKFDFFTCDWEWIPVKNVHPNANFRTPKPENLSEILEVARKLAGTWPQVRVDLYSEGNRIIFGELTFLHMAGRPIFEPQTYDDFFGDLISLPINNPN